MGSISFYEHNPPAALPLSGRVRWSNQFGRERGMLPPWKWRAQYPPGANVLSAFFFMRGISHITKIIA